MHDLVISVLFLTGALLFAYLVLQGEPGLQPLVTTETVEPIE